MSFSSDVKDELNNIIGQARHCQLAELASIVHFAGRIGKSTAGFDIPVENEYASRKYFTLLQKTFNINSVDINVFQALKIAVDSCSEFLKTHDMDITIVIFDRESFDIGRKKLKDIQAFIDDNYFDESRMWGYSAAVGTAAGLSAPFHPFGKKTSNRRDTIHTAHSVFPVLEDACSESLKEKLKMIDESFTEMLLRKIDEKGMKDSDCYKKANIDRKLFSKIRSDKDYHPKKVTAVAFAIALELDIDETKELLLKAGFGLSNSCKFHIIVRYFIESGNYNIYEINEVLFQFDQVLIGS